MAIKTGVPCKWTNDGQRFLLEHFDIICGSTSHIYHSALPLSPPSSWLKKWYSVEPTQAVKVIKGPEAGWGACFRTVPLGGAPHSISRWNNFVALGLDSGDVVILDATTGSQAVVFFGGTGLVVSGHIGNVMSVAFSSDDTLLVPGGIDKTVKLWDIQTGGVIKTFFHDEQVHSVSVSVESGMVASGTRGEPVGSGTKGGAVHLWDIQKQECKWVIKQQHDVHHVIFSPTIPQNIVSISGDQVQQWNIDGQKTKPTYTGTHISFSPAHTQLALCYEKVVTVQSYDSGAFVAEFHANDYTEHCCFSPDNKLVAAAVGPSVYVWDIISSEPHLLEIFEGYTDLITSLEFLSPSTLISTCGESVKFWQIESLSIDPDITNPKSTSSILAPINSVSLQVKDGIAISSDSSGVVKTWDIFTGLCKRSFQTPAQCYGYSDAHLIKDSLIFIWNDKAGIHFWDSNEDEPEKQILVMTQCNGLRISEDGSKVFCLTKDTVELWSIGTWKCVGKVECRELYLCLSPLHTDHLKIWIKTPNSIKGWDFGTLSSSPVPLPDTSVERPHLDLIYDSLELYGGAPKIRDMRTKRELFHFSGRYVEPGPIRWNGRYLVVGYHSGEVFVLDCHHPNVG